MRRQKGFEAPGMAAFVDRGCQDDLVDIPEFGLGDFVGVQKTGRLAGCAHAVDHEFGKHALTFWKVLERCGDWCRVELTPITGRSHQLRVHMLSIGHPLLGDGLYAHEQALAAWPRLCLHASMLSFTHPQSGERLRFECPAPF